LRPCDANCRPYFHLVQLTQRTDRFLRPLISHRDGAGILVVVRHLAVLAFADAGREPLARIARQPMRTSLQNDGLRSHQTRF
jgi:hypothetical protein